MFKILIWDYTGDSAAWCEKYLEKDVEVIQTVKPAQLVPEILLQKDSWDWLLIFERKMRKAFDETVQSLKLSPEKIIYARDTQSWVQHPKAIYSLLNNSEGSTIHRWLTFYNCRAENNFVTCTVEGLSYVATAGDKIIMPRMFINRVNWAAQDVVRFHELAKKYYGVDDSAGYFLDLGANIGTTGIYFLKKFAPKLKLLAFEPDPTNFKMHQVNIILNDLEDVADLVNCGLGDKFDEVTMYRNPVNPGANSIFKKPGKRPPEKIKVIPLDSYMAEKKIAAKDVKYIWIDTEGFEANVLLGAKNLLKENPAPIFMECNLKAWENSGCFEEMIALLAENYSHFIHFYRGEKIYPLDALRTMTRPNNPLGQIGDIFFIRKGTLDL